MDTHTLNKSKNRMRVGRLALLGATLMSMSLTGCSALFSPIDTIPANRVPKQFLAEKQANKISLDPARLRQEKPEYYTLDSKDVLGVYIGGVLGTFDEPPPVSLPAPNSDLPPAIGYPVPVRQDGTISLPMADPIPVRGLTIEQAENLIKRVFTEGPEPILVEKPRIIVTLMHERTYSVFVVRQDNSAAQRGQQYIGRGQSSSVTDRSDQSSRGFVLQMPAYKNDVLNALLQTGGIPGVNAKAEIRIMRGNRLATARRDQQVNEFYRTHKASDFPYGVIPTVPDDTNALRIPLRLGPGEVPTFLTEDIILRDGDVVYVDTRATDIYYTGGMLGSGEHSLPRDYDLDVLAAVSIAGTSLGVSQQAGRFGGGGQTMPPTELVVLRRIPGDRQLAIRIDLNDTINDPRQRMLVKPGDMLILRFKPCEEVVNFATSVFFTYGIRELFR